MTATTKALNYPIVPTTRELHDRLAKILPDDADYVAVPLRLREEILEALTTLDHGMAGLAAELREADRRIRGLGGPPVVYDGSDEVQPDRPVLPPDLYLDRRTAVFLDVYRYTLRERPDLTNPLPLVRDVMELYHTHVELPGMAGWAAGTGEEPEEVEDGE